MIRKVLPGDNEGALAALAVQVDQLRTEVGHLAGLRTDIAAHARAIDTLTALFRRRTETGSAAEDSEPLVPPVPDWLTVSDPARAIAWLSDLVVWVPRVWQRYPATAMPTCWPWHPAIVAELLVARHAWAEATIAGQSVLALATWHDRWRPTTASRVTKALSGCQRGAGCHVDAPGHHFRYDLAYLDEMAAWWATTEHPDPDAAPGLTRELGPHPRNRDTSPDALPLNGTRPREEARR